MNNGYFRLLCSVDRPDDVIACLECLPYDELIEFDPVSGHFTTLNHVTKKYAMSMTDGAFKELFIQMSESLVHPDYRGLFVSFLEPDSLSFRLGESELKGAAAAEFPLKELEQGWLWTEIILLSCERFGLGSGYRMYIFDVQSRRNRQMGVITEHHSPASDRNEMTGLIKKRTFIPRAQKLLSQSKESMCFVAIDIENFKLFNEWFGHDRGDFLMGKIGACLENAQKKYNGLAGYFGQDDFCLLMPYDNARIEELYDEIRETISEYGGSNGFLPAFGVSVVDDKAEVRDLIDRAFLASEFAKKNYRSRIALYDHSMNTDADAEYRVISDFFPAMKDREITFYLQPQCHTTTGRIVGAEALARWVKPDGTVIPPIRFIPALEKHGLITDLDMYIWESVFRWQREHIDKGLTPLPVSVNVSTVDIANIDLAEFFEQLVQKYEIERGLVKIEITETAYITNASTVADTVRSLRDRGFIVMMDDFGSGYSSLNMLKELSVDVIKLDAHFLRLDKNVVVKGLHILESILNMTRTIGVPVIVEGVESEEQKRLLEDIGCSYIQGFYFYRPMKASDYEELIGDPGMIDTTGVVFKANQQFRVKEILDDNVYSDTMLNNILGPCAIYSWHDGQLDIVRYNEQFYMAVDVPNYDQRLRSIQQYMPERDLGKLYSMLERAEEDRLNGAAEVLHFFKPDGFLTSFYMRFYYLRDEGQEKKFYGSVQNITKLMTMESQLNVLSRYSSDTVVFMRLDPEPYAKVLFHGLEKELGCTAGELEALINSECIYDLMVADDLDALRAETNARMEAGESFVNDIVFKGAEGKLLKVNIRADYIRDDDETVDYIVIFKKADA